MKIIHTADIHLGSKMDSRYPRELVQKRKEELKNTFLRMVEYAQKNEVKVILLCGDLFDSDTPLKKEKDFFYSVVKDFSSIDFLYLKGNHDLKGGYDGEKPENLYLFGNDWKYYFYDNVVIGGIEITSDNYMSFYSTLKINKDSVNIVMLHGQIADSVGMGNICLKKMRNKNIDYLALGHVHKIQEGRLDERGNYVYSGCLEGRGIDEAGKHGFYLLDVGTCVNYCFVPFAEREIIALDVDITGVTSAYDAVVRIKNKIKFDKKNIYRINLIGETEIDSETIERDIEKYLSNVCTYVSIKDKTTKKIDIEKYAGDLSIKGEFVRTVFSDKSLSDDEKIQIIRCGLRALTGDEVDL